MLSFLCFIFGCIFFDLLFHMMTTLKNFYKENKKIMESFPQHSKLKVVFLLLLITLMHETCRFPQTYSLFVLLVHIQALQKQKFWYSLFSMIFIKKEKKHMVTIYVALSSMFLTDFGEKQNHFHTSVDWENFLSTSFWLCAFQTVSLLLPT